MSRPGPSWGGPHGEPKRGRSVDQTGLWEQVLGALPDGHGITGFSHFHVPDGHGTTGFSHFQMPDGHGTMGFYEFNTGEQDEAVKVTTVSHFRRLGRTGPL